jgi:hypothetical protein
MRKDGFIKVAEKIMELKMLRRARVQFFIQRLRLPGWGNPLLRYDFLIEMNPRKIGAITFSIAK